MGIQSIDVTQESTGRRVPKLVSEGSQIVSKLVSKGEQLDFRQQGIQIMNVNCERWGMEETVAVSTIFAEELLFWMVPLKGHRYDDVLLRDATHQAFLSNSELKCTVSPAHPRRIDVRVK